MTLPELRRWMLLATGLAYWLNVLQPYQPARPLELRPVVSAVLSNGAFNVVAWLMIASSLRRAEPPRPASRRQIVGALAVASLCGVPTGQATIIGLLISGVMLLSASGPPGDRRIGILLVGLAVQMVWTSDYLLPLHAIVAHADARICEAMLRLFGTAVQVRGNLLENAAAAIDIEILGPCAASFPLAGVAMAFLTVVVFWGRLPCRSDWPWLLLALFGSVVLTETRLSLMALGDAAYFWIHDGDGAALYTVSATIFAIAFPTLAARGAVNTVRRAA